MPDAERNLKLSIEVVLPAGSTKALDRLNKALGAIGIGDGATKGAKSVAVARLAELKREATETAKVVESNAKSEKKAAGEKERWIKSGAELVAREQNRERTRRLSNFNEEQRLRKRAADERKREARDLEMGIARQTKYQFDGANKVYRWEKQAGSERQKRWREESRLMEHGRKQRERAAADAARKQGTQERYQRTGANNVAGMRGRAETDAQRRWREEARINEFNRKRRAQEEARETREYVARSSRRIRLVEQRERAERRASERAARAAERDARRTERTYDRSGRSSGRIMERRQGDFAGRASTWLRGRGMDGAANFASRFSSNLSSRIGPEQGMFGKAIMGAQKFKGVLVGVTAAGMHMYQRISWGMHQLRSAFLALTVAAYGINMVIQPLDMLMQRLGQVATRGVQALAGLGKAALQSAGDMEYMRFRMDAVFGAQGKEHWEWLMGFSVGMPHNIEQLGDAFNTLGVYGVESMVDIRRAMQAVTDSSAALNKVPNDVAMAISLGSKGAPGGSRRLRQMGITTEDIIRAGGSQKRSDTGKLSDHLDPNQAGRNADAILRVMERKFGGIGVKMANTWNQIMNDMMDMWLRFTYALTETPAFKLLVGIMASIRTKFVEMMESGELQKLATRFAGAFLSVKPVLMYMAERLPGAVYLVMSWIERGGNALSNSVAKIQAAVQKTGKAKFVDDQVKTAQKLIGFLGSVLSFYIDLKITSMQIRAVLALAIAEINMALVKWPKFLGGQGKGPDTNEYKDAQGALNTAKGAYGALDKTGPGSIRGTLKKWGSGLTAELQKAAAEVGGLLGGPGDGGISKNAEQFANTAIRNPIKQGSEEMEDAIESGFAAGVNKVDSFLNGASTLETMRYLFLTKSGFSPENAVKSLEAEKKQRGAMDRSYGTGIVTGDRYMPGARGADFVAGDDTGPDSAASAQQEAANTQQQAADKQVSAADKLFAYLTNPNYSGNMDRDVRNTKAAQAWRVGHPDAAPAGVTPASSTPASTYTPPAAGTSFGPNWQPAEPGETPKQGSALNGWKKVGALGLGIWGGVKYGGRWVKGKVGQGWAALQRWRQIRATNRAGSANARAAREAAGIPARVIPDRNGGWTRNPEVRGGVRPRVIGAQEVAPTANGAPPWNNYGRADMPGNVGRGAQATRGGFRMPRIPAWASRIGGKAAPWLERGGRFLGKMAIPGMIAQEAYGVYSDYRRIGKQAQAMGPRLPFGEGVRAGMQGAAGLDASGRVLPAGVGTGGGGQQQVIIQQNFYGYTEPQQVREASHRGARDAALQQGRRQAAAAH